MARRKKGRRATRSVSDMNVTPLGDVSLSLLLGFLVITPIITETMSATLPQEGAGMAGGAMKQDPIVVLTAQNTVLVNGQEVSREKLPAKLAELLPEDARIERKVMFTGSSEVQYSKVIDLLDLLKEHGVEAIGIR